MIKDVIVKTENDLKRSNIISVILVIYLSIGYILI